MIKTKDGYSLRTDITRGTEGQPPDIWLYVDANIVSPVIVHLTPNEALQLAQSLLRAVVEAEQ